MPGPVFFSALTGVRHDPALSQALYEVSQKATQVLEKSKAKISKVINLTAKMATYLLKQKPGWELKEAFQKRILDGEAHCLKVQAQTRAVEREMDAVLFWIEMVFTRMTRSRVRRLKNQVAIWAIHIHALEALVETGPSVWQ